MLKCYFLDDEQHAVDAIVAMMKKKFAGQVQIVGSSVDALKAIEEIENKKPDVLFLDVEMPKLNGLDLLKYFPQRSFEVIFTTAHEKYALSALKASAVDYLVKPLSPQDVFDALQKCIAKQHAANAAPKELFKLSLHTTNGTLFIHLPDIIRIEADNNYSHFFLTNQPKLTICKTLKEFEDQLTNHDFFRIHQSHLINLKHLISITNKDGDYAILAQNHKVIISRRRKADLMLRLKESH
jgi:two-component system, LytTR family, response regulator